MKDSPENFSRAVFEPGSAFKYDFEAILCRRCILLQVTVNANTAAASKQTVLIVNSDPQHDMMHPRALRKQMGK